MSYHIKDVILHRPVLHSYSVTVATVATASHKLECPPDDRL